MTNDEDILIVEDDELFDPNPRPGARARQPKLPTINAKDLQARVLTYFEDRFGITSNAFGPFGLYLATKGRVYLGPKTVLGHLNLVSVGILVARVGESNAIKPTTNLLQLFGKYVKKNQVELRRDAALNAMAGNDLVLSSAEIGGATDGYVLLTYAGFPLGCGHLKGNTLRNMVPKAKRIGVKYL